jgi:hypothetical protein
MSWDCSRAIQMRVSCFCASRSRLLEDKCSGVHETGSTSNNHLVGSINAMHLKTRLGDVETDCTDRLHLAPPNGIVFIGKFSPTLIPAPGAAPTRNTEIGWPATLGSRRPAGAHRRRFRAGQALGLAGQNNVPATLLFVGAASRGWGNPRRGGRAGGGGEPGTPDDSRTADVGVV